MPTHHKILALIYHDFEALDVFGPLGSILPHNDYYTFKIASLGPDAPEKNGSSQGIESSMKNAVGVVPTLSLDEALREEEQFDTLFIPGGMGTRPLIEDADLLRQVGSLAQRAKNVFTVCTGSILLAATGLLDGRKATTNKRLFDEMTPNHPSVQWQKQARWVQDGKFLTSSGIAAGIDAAFAFISNTYVAPENQKAVVSPENAVNKGDATSIPGYDREKAIQRAKFVAFGLEYRWHSDPADDPFVDPPKDMDATIQPLLYNI